MTDLSTPSKGRLSRKTFVGKRYDLSCMANKPLLITDYDIVPSKLSPGKELLLLQVFEMTTGPAMLWTEGLKLINTIKQAESKPPYYCKIIRNNKGYWCFVRLTEKEKLLLNEVLTPF